MEKGISLGIFWMLYCWFTHKISCWTMTNKFPQLFFFPLSVDDIYKDEPARRHKSVWLWMNLKKRGGPETWNDNDVFDFTGWAKLGETKLKFNSNANMPTYSSLHGFTRPCNIIARVYDIITSTWHMSYTEKLLLSSLCVYNKLKYSCIIVHS